MNAHLAILKNKYVESIIDGEKVVESRFMKGKCPPFGKVFPGDVVFLKKSGGPVVAKARVLKVASFEFLSPELIKSLKKHFNSLIKGDDLYWEDAASSASCGMFVWLWNVEKMEPTKISKKDMRAWVVLKEGKDFGLGKYI